MKILLVASECAPIAKVGGLADVIGSLPQSLKETGTDVSVVIPFYSTIKKNIKNPKLVQKDVPVYFEGVEKTFNLWQTNLPDSSVPLFLIENEKYFGGEGIYIETDASSGGSKEEAARFLFLSLAALKIAQLFKIEILHCHDWHVGIIPFLVKKNNLKIKTVFTIHNLGYQGAYSQDIVNLLLGTDFTQGVNCLILGILNADILTTVSPKYAKEILTPEFGFGLEVYLKERKKDLVGILNGLDENTFNPKTDPYIVKNYSSEDFKAKEENKIHLQNITFGKPNLKIPIISIVSRLAPQKGMDLVQKIFPLLVRENLQFVLLGKGTLEYEEFFKEMAKKNPEKFWAKIDFDENLAHQIYAGSDIFLMPSLYEPCGLGQLIAMKYGTIPVARAVGGLKDTIFPKKTGFLFEKYDSQEFFETIKSALKSFENKKIWKELQENAINQDFSWKKSAKEYLRAYQKALG